MIRNRRADTLELNGRRRNVRNNFIEFSMKKNKLYIMQLTIGVKQDADHILLSQSLTLQREACSSREAVYYSLKKNVAKRQKENPAYITGSTY